MAKGSVDAEAEEDAEEGGGGGGGEVCDLDADAASALAAAPAPALDVGTWESGWVGGVRSQLKHLILKNLHLYFPNHHLAGASARWSARPPLSPPRPRPSPMTMVT